MAHTIEVAKSGRAGCRTCRQNIAKGELRFGEETLNAFSDSGGTSFQWHHLKCAAQKKPHQLKEALGAFQGEIPDRAALEQLIGEAELKVKPAFPYVERSPSARSKCLECGEVIEKGVLRVAVEQEVQAAGFTTKGARYLHLGCAKSQGPDIGEKVLAHSRGLTADETAEIQAAFA
jgi:hypothetical protein